MGEPEDLPDAEVSDLEPVSSDRPPVDSTTPAFALEKWVQPHIPANSHKPSFLSFPPTGTRVRYFGDYELYEEIARGGMGVVYRARQVRLNRQVALKMIQAGKFSSQTEIQRLRIEAEAAAQLDHPSIVTIFEVGEYDGLHYFTMAFIEGQTLSEKLADGPLHSAAAAKLMQTVAEAVAYAHERGVIHRDLKPGNILIDQTGQPRVTDFGLAKQVTCDSDLTATGQILGTPSYMPPEQALGKLEDIGQAADVYSLGAVLYATLTGRPPFVAQTSVETLRLVVDEQPPNPRLLNPSVSRDLETICLKCLEKSIPRRYASAKQVAEELERFLRGDPILARPAGSLRHFVQWYRRHWAIATSGLTIVLATLIVVGVLAVTTRRLRSELSRTAKAEQAAVNSNRQSQDRLWVSYLNEANAQHRSRQSGQRFGALRTIRSAMQIPPPPGRSLDELRTAATAALCLPDIEVERTLPHSSRDLLFAIDSSMSLFGSTVDARHEFVVRDVRTNTVSMTIPQAEWREGKFDYQGPTFSPNSRYLIYPKLVDAESRLHVWRVGNDRPLIDLGPDAGVVTFRPDSLECAVAYSNGLIRILECEEFREVARYETGIVGPSPSIAWNPERPLLAVANKNQWQVIDLQAQLVHSRCDVTEELEGWINWDPTGKYLSAGTLDRRIQTWDADSAMPAVTPIHQHLNAGTIVRYSPDGDRLVSNDWNQVLRLWDTRTGQQLLSVPAYGSKLQFSDDGTLLAADCTPTEFRIFRYHGGNEFRGIRERAGDDSHFTSKHSIPCVDSTGRLLAVRTSTGVCLIDLLHDQVVCRLPIQSNGPFRFDETAKGVSLWTYGQAGLLSWPVHLDESTGMSTIGPPERLTNANAENVWGSSRDGEIVISPTKSGGRLWNRRTLERGLLRHEPDMRCCAVSPDGRLGVTGSHTPQQFGVVVWDIASRTKIAELPVPGLTGVLFSPDGNWLITNGDGTRIWQSGQWQSSRMITPIKAFPCFSPNSQLLALSDDLSIVRLVEPQTGREIAVLTAPERTRLKPIAFTPDGGRLITIGEETEAVHIFDLRAIRRQLFELNLDWDYPPFPPPQISSHSPLLNFQVNLGTFPAMKASEDTLIKGTYHQMEGRMADAIKEYRIAIWLDPDNARALNHFAWLMLTGPPEWRSPEEALAAASRAVKLEPFAPQYLNTLGLAHYRRNNWNDAISAIQKGISAKDSANASDGFVLAMAHWQRGEPEQARQWMQYSIEWIKRNPENDPSLSEFRREAEALFAAPR